MAAVKKKNTVKIGGHHLAQDEKVLVERGGKFELITVSKLKDMLPTQKESKLKEKQVKKKKKNAEKQRTADISASRFMEIQAPKNKKKAAPSTSKQKNISNRTSTIDQQSIKSPYAMSPEMKMMMRKLAAARDAKRKDEEEFAKLAEEESRQMAELAWKAWLEKKNKESKSQKSEDDQDDTAQQKREAIKAYKAWIRSKHLEIRKERLLLQQLQIEKDEGFYLCGRKDCNKAFRVWMRKKSKAISKEKEDAEKARKQTRAEARSAKRSQDLIQSIQQSEQMKFVEYYGYRF